VSSHVLAPGLLVVLMTKYPRSVVEEAASIVAEERPNGCCGKRART